MNKMTWKRAVSVASALGVLGALALTAGADWVDGFAVFFGR